MKIKNIAFYLGMGTLFAHELDAMPNHEWQVLPLTSWMPNEIGMIVFVLLHIPLFAILIAWFIDSLCVIENYRRRGIGEKLISLTKEKAIKMDTML